MSKELLPCPTCAATAKRVSIGNRNVSLVQVCCSAECGRLEWSEYAWNHHAMLANVYREKCGEQSTTLAERDARIAELEAAFKHLHSLHGTNFGYVLANSVDDYYHKLFPEKYNPHKEAGR